jgi:hypothetical protein
LTPTDAERILVDQCFIAGSFLAPFEVAMREDVRIQNLMWGSDYPHR